MAISTRSVTVSTTAIALSAVDSVGTVKLSKAAGETLFVGASDVTTSTGLAIVDADGLIDVPLNGDNLYGIVVTGPLTVTVLQS